MTDARATASPPPNGWEPPPERPSLSAGCVQVWQIDLEPPEPIVARLRSWLTPEERQRADRLVQPRHGRRFVAARGQLRAILASYLGCDPAAIAFRYGPQGKPALAPTLDLEFNLSHSGSRGLLAVTRGRPIGVDIEEIRPMADFEAIARRFFAPAEADALMTVPEPDRLTAFYRCWTRKEAFVKVDGQGLTYRLDAFTVSLHRHEPARLLQIDGSIPAAAAWTLRHLDPDPGYIGCLALKGSIDRLSCFRASAERLAPEAPAGSTDSEPAA